MNNQTMNFSFSQYFADQQLDDRFERQPDKAIDVVIPILHTNELWRANLFSIYREIPVNYLILGDGGCIDNSIDVAREFPRLRVLDHRSVKTLGFSIRRLIEDVETPWFVYLHSDVYLPEGWFDAMFEGQHKYDWFESGQNTLTMARTLSETLAVERAYSGGQMGRKAAFDSILLSIDDDYLYRNEDIIIANLIKTAGFRYGKVAETFLDHQQMIKESPWLRRVKRVGFDLELSYEEEVRAAMTYVKGIVKYLVPEQSHDLIAGLHQNIARLVEMGALLPDEFPRWVLDHNPTWSQVFPLPQKLSALVEPLSFGKRLRWAPSAVCRRAGWALDRMANYLAPKNS